MALCGLLQEASAPGIYWTTGGGLVSPCETVQDMFVTPLYRQHASHTLAFAGVWTPATRAELICHRTIHIHGSLCRDMDPLAPTTRRRGPHRHRRWLLHRNTLQQRLSRRHPTALPLPLLRFTGLRHCLLLFLLPRLRRHRPTTARSRRLPQMQPVGGEGQAVLKQRRQLVPPGRGQLARLAVAPLPMQRRPNRAKGRVSAGLWKEGKRGEGLSR